MSRVKGGFVVALELFFWDFCHCYILGLFFVRFIVFLFWGCGGVIFEREFFFWLSFVFFLVLGWLLFWIEFVVFCLRG